MNFRFHCLPILVLTGVLVLSGCQQTRPLTAEGLKRIEARTARGTVNTKLEAKPQPEKPRAGEFSFWDLKVFDIKPNEEGGRKEWKFFVPLPQSSDNATISTVQMNAWIISRDGRVFLPARPKYQAYGSFNTDWTIPRAGPYRLFVEYQPAQKGMVELPVEMAHWEFNVEPGKSAEKPVRAEADWSPTSNPVPITIRGAANGEPAGTLSIENLPTTKNEAKAVKVSGVPDGALDLQLATLSQNGDFSHPNRADDGTFTVKFAKSGMVRVWAYFTLNGVPYAAPINVSIG